jgi:hypothetical protein
MLTRKHGDIGMEKTTLSVSNTELSVAFSGPAVASNRFFVTLGPVAVRIAFCEQNGPEIGPNFRTAVSLPIPEALALMELLQRLLQPIESKTSGASNG